MTDKRNRRDEPEGEREDDGEAEERLTNDTIDDGLQETDDEQPAEFDDEEWGSVEGWSSRQPVTAENEDRLGDDGLEKMIGDDALPPRPDNDEAKDDIRETVLEEVQAFFEEQSQLRKEAEERIAEEEETRRAAAGVLGRLKKKWRIERPAEHAIPDESFVRTNWFDFDYLEGHQEVKRRWVNYPYSYISILYDPEERLYRYHVSEPLLTEFEQYVREDLRHVLRNSLMYQNLEDESEREQAFKSKMYEVLDEHAAAVSEGTIAKLMYYFGRDFLGYGRIDPLMKDPGIEDISCDGEKVPVFVYHRAYRDLRTNITFESQHLNSLVIRLAQRAGKHISVSNPLVDASLPDGSRIQLTLGTDVSTRGSNFTVRRFSEVPHSPIDLIKWNTFSIEQMAYYWLAIENNMSLIFAGGTGSGKTTSMNAVSLFIPPDSKVVSIEDTREIVLPHDNWVQSVTRESATATGEGEISTYNLLQASLRQRPEYILVGEIRTEQRVALTFFQAIGTGHTAYSTFHADSVSAVMARMQNPPLSVPSQMLQNLDIISVQRQVSQGRDRVRRNETIVEILPSEGDQNEVRTQTLFERQPDTDEHHRVNESSVLDRIAYQEGWSKEELQAEFDNRCEVLSYLVENDITAFEDVTHTIETYSRAPDEILDRIRGEETTLVELFTQ